MWRKSLDCGTMPEGLIRSIITPIYKGGTKCEPPNYRPVALTSHLTKVFERVLHKAILNHLIDNNLLNESQHGFRPGRGTLSQLLKFYDSILTMLESGGNVDSIHLDFAKAFDKVDHQMLLQKLKYHNIGGKILNWITTFLTNRVQAVRVDNQLSAFTKVKSGVPQGSVLGPLLFLIMMFDIDIDICTAMIASFADDTKLWQLVKTDFCSDLLQLDLNTAYQWADTNNKEFNGKSLSTSLSDKMKNAVSISLQPTT